MAGLAEQEIQHGNHIVDGKCLSLGGELKSDMECGIMPVSIDSDVYRMDHSRKGRCIIFNIKNFEPHTKLKERRGSDVDAASLCDCFQHLGFDVTLHKNVSKRTMLKELRKASREDHKDNDTFACIILTYGNEGIVNGSDGKFNATEIYEHFSADVCPSLAGKPKLFFIQACRADRQKHDSSDSMPSYRIPCFADFLIACCTIPGFYSWENEIKGSWFIQTLCSVFEKNYKEKELLEMLTMVNKEVVDYLQIYMTNEVEPHMRKQITYLTSVLTEKFYFSSMLTRKVYFTRHS